MMVRLKRLIIGTPLERLARSLYIRLDPSPWGEYDRLTLAIMRRCLRPNSNCVDIGAHRGTILAEIVRQAPDGIHYAFEPVPEHSRYLAKAFPKVRVYELALSNVREQASFLHDLEHPTRSSFRRRAEVGRKEVIQVQTDLLDNILPVGWRVDFIKLDVEGAELPVMQGAVKTLRTQQPVVVFEQTQLAQECYGVTPEGVYTFLTQECGMRISLLRNWLSGAEVLTRAAFESEVTEGLSLYFVAHG
jgi:FkbM family methyltransferase